MSQVFRIFALLIIALHVTPAVAATRIVSLAPALTELVYAAGAGAQLVGVSAHSDFPAAARKLPIVADASTINREALAALAPDLILAWKTGTSQQLIESLQAAALPVRVMDGSRLDDIPRLLLEIGELAETQRQAEAAAASFSLELANIRKQHAASRVVPAMLEIWHAPLVTIAAPHFMSDALAACGARNVFADLGSIAPQISLESVVAADPEAIVGAGSAQGEAAFRANWSRFGTLRAVRQRALLYLEPDTIQRQTPRILQGIRKLCIGIEGVRASTRSASQ